MPGAELCPKLDDNGVLRTVAHMAKHHAQFWNLPELSSGALGTTPLTHSLTYVGTPANPVGVPELLANSFTNLPTTQARSASSRTTPRGFSRCGATTSLATGRASRPSGARARVATPWDLGCPSRPWPLAPHYPHHSPLTSQPSPSPSLSPPPPPSPSLHPPILTLPCRPSPLARPLWTTLRGSKTSSPPSRTPSTTAMSSRPTCS